MISVIVPVYNGEKSLVGCIQSIENQTYKNIEIIICDDGSDDGSAECAHRPAQEYGNITVLQIAHKGVCAARNAALDVARGEYISFIDCDDEIRCDMYSEMISSFDKHDIQLCAVGILRKKGGESFYTPYSGDRVVIEDNAARLYLVPMYFNSCSNKLYRADIIARHNLRFDEGVHIGEDFLFNCEYAQHICRVAVISQPMYIYNMSGATIKPFSDKNRFDIIARMYNSIIPSAKGDAQIEFGIKEKICDEYLLAIRLFCISDASFWAKVRTLRAVFASDEYLSVAHTAQIGGIYAKLLKMHSAFLTVLYYSAKKSLKRGRKVFA